MGVGLSSAVGANAAKPNTLVICLHGDGSFGHNAMELDTAVRHKRPLMCIIIGGGWTADPNHNVHCYGAQNFLWLSDIALGMTTAAVVSERPLPASLAAVAVLPLEITWNVDFVSRGRLIGLDGYMFDRKLPRGLRALSLFHVALPPTLLWLLREFGYDRRAVAIQCGITWTVLPLTYAFTDPAQNINWVFGPCARPQQRIPPLLYLTLAMLAFPLLVHWPTHIALRRLFRPARLSSRGR